MCQYDKEKKKNNNKGRRNKNKCRLTDRRRNPEPMTSPFFFFGVHAITRNGSQNKRQEAFH